MDSSKPNLTHILGHPLRLSLYELIRDGTKTTPELAEILNVNRINLYHHLNKMEEGGLITSSYNSDRVKRYKISQEHPTQENTSERQITATHTIVMSEPKESVQNSEFQKRMREVSEQFGQPIPAHHKIIQVHIFTQSNEINRFKREKLDQLKFKKNQQ